MNIEMAGIDHLTAELCKRELFAFTKSAAVAAMSRVKNEYGVQGCVILSTCNRTELWVSHSDGQTVLADDILCRLVGVSLADNRSIIARRVGEAAVKHLLETACGLKSRIFGEEQIITQVGEALLLAHDCAAADSVLERLFRTAVTAAKRVKTTVRLTAVDSSVATRTAEVLRGEYGNLSGLCCLVIGSGEIGRLTAEELNKNGCNVKMTIRRYKNGESVIPPGCSAIKYEERLSVLRTAQAVVSATSSPHYTLHYDDVIPCLDGQKKVLIDLAVPRDISPRLKTAAGVILYDIDSLCGTELRQTKSDELRQAECILEQYDREFTNWYYFRSLIPKVSGISSLAAKDITGRVQKTIMKLELDPDEQKKLQYQLENASAKVVSKLMFGLRDYLPPERWDECIESMEKAVQK